VLLWDKRVKPEAAAIAALDQPGRLRLAMACIRDIRAVWEQALHPAASEEAREFIAAAIEQLDRASQSSEIPVNDARRSGKRVGSRIRKYFAIRHPTHPTPLLPRPPTP
jgi:hypothetical protein